MGKCFGKQAASLSIAAVAVVGTITAACCRMPPGYGNPGKMASYARKENTGGKAEGSTGCDDCMCPAIADGSVLVDGGLPRSTITRLLGSAKARAPAQIHVLGVHESATSVASIKLASTRLPAACSLIALCESKQMERTGSWWKTRVGREMVDARWLTSYVNE